jgi:thiamine biosynthesis lipoprotein ApbE
MMLRNAHLVLLAYLTTASTRTELPGVELDLSAVTKGYAVDRLGHGQEKLGYRDFPVVRGGELALIRNIRAW